MERISSQRFAVMSRNSSSRGETDANALLFASEGILRTPFHLFQRSYLQRHGLHLIASMFRRRSRNPPAVSQEQ